uniref:Uncharacterized protein n=1 Tax=Chelonoidis abingdonii TaxID=106734 RepID=A0A8C0GNV3_CHEAB
MHLYYFLVTCLKNIGQKTGCSIIFVFNILLIVINNIEAIIVWRNKIPEWEKVKKATNVVTTLKLDGTYTGKYQIRMVSYSLDQWFLNLFRCLCREGPWRAGPVCLPAASTGLCFFPPLGHHHFTDPFAGAPPEYIHRLSEIKSFQCETIRQEQNKKLKRGKKEETWTS